MNPEMQVDAMKRLACGIIAQALDDWRLIVSCKNRKLDASADAQLQALKEFFQARGGMDQLIQDCGLDLTGDEIRRGMGFQ